ncbi:hypothetical protein BGZ97_002146 [Linnemannia gamsii]|uniref:Uncharacterized protein n=1 Tax=Linnemannia gamsii TaxID=64522 RepID=A0A9P6QZA0_9FUNG|nr:hypothetical protein BGZ97_002146 [Linnemannia gamsii]
MVSTTIPISRSITKAVLSKEQVEGVGACIRRSIDGQCQYKDFAGHKETSRPGDL